MKLRNTFIWLVLILCFSNAHLMAQESPERLLIGYWHNWMYSPNNLTLLQVPEAYDVVNIAFAAPTVPLGSTMQFVPDAGLYPNLQNFINDVNTLQGQGKKVLISVGGANGPINLNNAADIQNFVSSLLTIINTYGFDGLDVDLEGNSLYILPGDLSFANPTSPLIVNFITALDQLLDLLPPDFMLTAAPETAHVQGGYSYYGGVWGAYLPVIHAFRNRWSYIHVQHYNTGAMFGRDGILYQPATADFHVAMADMLLAGFPVAGGQYFDPLDEDQVAIGLPASAQAAGSGYTPPLVVQTALDYIIFGRPFGGQYQLANSDGYLGFRGLMTWSINWDVANNLLFSNSHGLYLAGPLQLTLTPQSPPIVIPALGGRFDFNIVATNSALTTQLFDLWIMMLLPGGSSYGPVLSPVNLTLPGSGNITRLRTQNIPRRAPAGACTYRGYVGDYPAKWDSSSFTFEKLGSGIQGSGFGDWANTGESLGNEVSSFRTSNLELRTSISPNPFNPITAISYQLSVNSQVRLEVFDLSGRSVAVLVNGIQDAGIHQITWDASGLPSGLYFCRIEAGSFTDVIKMMLLK